MEKEIYDFFINLNFSSVVWQIVTPLCFCLGDIITGYIQAWINKNVDSQKMRIGLLHKVLLILIIILSFIINFAFNMKCISVFVCLYIIIMETVSILENLSKAGVNIRFLIDILKKKED